MGCPHRRRVGFLTRTREAVWTRGRLLASHALSFDDVVTPSMTMRRIQSVAPAVCLSVALVGCSGSAGTPTAPGSENVVNLYNWADYLDPSVIPAFENEYGIRVNYDVYDSNEVLETKLLAGHTNYDVVVPSGYFLERQIKAGIYQKLDKKQLPNLKNVDAEVARGMAIYDPGNQYAVDYMWLSTTGIGYDLVRIKARLPGAPLDSWRMVFDPTVIAQFQDCGVSMLDAPVDVVGAALIYLGRDPNSESAEDLKAVEKLLRSVRPYIRSFNSSQYMYDLADGNLCLALGWSGDLMVARVRAKEAGKSVDLAFSIPREGTVSNFDALAIPADAPHPRNAHLFINYLLRPDVAAKNSNLNMYANSVMSASMGMLSDVVRNDPVVYPPPQVRAKLVPSRAKSAGFTRQLMHMWTRIKANTP
jgi:putrescine transport system substrate-binding protein